MIIIDFETFMSSFFWPLTASLIFILITFIVSKRLIKRRITITINYTDSFWTSFYTQNFVCLYVTIINDNEFDLNNITFESEPINKLVDNIWKSPNIRNVGSPFVIFSALEMIQGSFGEEPISVASRDQKSGYLIFNTDDEGCHISSLVMSYQDRLTKIKVHKNKINKKNLQNSK